MAQLHNRADVNGMFDNVNVTDYTELFVELTALDITKTADKEIWVQGELEYTITVTNIDDSTPGLPVTDTEVTDTIDPAIARLVDGSVEIDGVAADPSEYTYDPATGLLTVQLGTVVYGTARVITFRVEMPQP